MIDPDEYGAFYQSYVERVGDADIGKFLRDQREEMREFLARIPAALASHRYADGKWTVKQLIQHVIDAERVFAYRMLRIGRGDSTPLPGFDENEYADQANASDRTLEELLVEFDAVRAATLILYESLPREHLHRRGEASGAPVTARALAYLIAGHCAHHHAILRDRYGLE